MANETTTDQNSGAAGNDGKSGTSELDRLLNEYKEGKSETPKTEYATVRPVLDAIKPIAEYAQGKMEEERNAAVKKSVDDAISFVKSDESLKPVSDKLVRGYLNDQYANDQSFKAAYDNRLKDPKAWESALQGAQKGFREEVTSLSRLNLRSDVEAATAAVRGSGRVSSDGDKADPAKLNEMSDVEFARFKAQQEAKRRSA